MAFIFSEKPGTVTVVNIPDLKGVGILQIADFPSNTAIVTTAFELNIKARTSIDYSLANVPYIYVFGTSLTELGVVFTAFPFVSGSCDPSYSVASVLSYLDGKLVSAVGTPRIMVSVNGVSWRGVLTDCRIQTGVVQASPEIAAVTFRALGNFI